MEEEIIENYKKSFNNLKKNIKLNRQFGIKNDCNLLKIDNNEIKVIIKVKENNVDIFGRSHNGYIMELMDSLLNIHQMIVRGSIITIFNYSSKIFSNAYKDDIIIVSCNIEGKNEDSGIIFANSKVEQLIKPIDTNNSDFYGYNIEKHKLLLIASSTAVYHDNLQLKYKNSTSNKL